MDAEVEGEAVSFLGKFWALVENEDKKAQATAIAVTNLTIRLTGRPLLSILSNPTNSGADFRISNDVCGSLYRFPSLFFRRPERMYHKTYVYPAIKIASTNTDFRVLSLSRPGSIWLQITTS